MKRIIIFILCFIFISISASASYQPIVDIKQNNEYVDSDVKGIFIKNSVFVPVRYVAIALGIEEISWEEREKSVLLKTPEKELTLFIDKNYAYINGRKITMDKAPVMIDSRTFVPVRFIAETFGSEVKWESDMYAVNIKNSLSLSSKNKNTEYNDNDIYWLSRIIEAESSGEPMEGKIAVGNVIINRKESPDFPDTVYEVIFEKTKGKYQFTPVKNNTIYNTPSSDSLIAAKHALNDTELAGDALFFLNPEKTSSSWVINNRIYHLTINNHDFYL